MQISLQVESIVVSDEYKKAEMFQKKTLFFKWLNALQIPFRKKNSYKIQQYSIEKYQISEILDQSFHIHNNIKV